MMSPRNVVGSHGGGGMASGSPTGAPAPAPLPPPPPIKPPALMPPPPPNNGYYHHPSSSAPQQQRQQAMAWHQHPHPHPHQASSSASSSPYTLQHSGLPPGAAPPMLAGHIEDTLLSLPPPPPLMRPKEMLAGLGLGLGIQHAVGSATAGGGGGAAGWPAATSAGHMHGGDGAQGGDDDEDGDFEEDEELARALLSPPPPPPSIPALPASPSLDMAYFQGRAEDAQAPLPPPPSSEPIHRLPPIPPAAAAAAAAPLSPTSPTSAVISSYLASSPGPPPPPPLAAFPLPPQNTASPLSSSSPNMQVLPSQSQSQPQRRTSRASTSLAGTLNRRPSFGSGGNSGGLMPVKFSPTKAQVMAQQQQQRRVQQRDMDQEILSPIENSSSAPGWGIGDGRSSPSPARRPSPAAATTSSSSAASSPAKPVMNIIASSPARAQQVHSPMAAPSQPQRDRLRALPPLETNGYVKPPPPPPPQQPPQFAPPRQPDTQALLSPHSAAAQELPRRGASLMRHNNGVGAASPTMDSERTPTEAALSAILDEMLENPSPALRGSSDMPHTIPAVGGPRRRKELPPPRTVRRRTRCATFCDILVEEGVQAQLFPRLNVSTFLALLGATPGGARRCISGEVVGRWVCGEWGITLDGQESWPGLGVWEGFLESLLHDPEAYATYPNRLHDLLEHLCLSHTLIVLFLRTLPASAFPVAPPFPFEDESSLGASGLPTSVSNLSIAANNNARRGGLASEAGFPPKMPLIPKAERVVELVMPTPLSTAPPPPDPVIPTGPPPTANRRLRRSSVGSASFVSWNRNKSGASSSDSGSIFNDVVGSGASQVHQTRKGALPPVSFPSAKRYHFKGYDKSPRSRTSSESGRPGSTWSQDESIAGRSRRGDMLPPPPVPQIPRFIGNGSVVQGRHSPTISSNLRPDRTASSSPSYQNRSSAIDPAFDKPIPFVHGRAPLLRVFVPLSADIPKWPSAQAAARVRRELERCGAWGKLRIGDVIINTALTEPLIPRHLMLFVPTMSPFLVPIEFRQSAQGHLPAYIDALRIPPSYHFPLLPEPQIVHLDLSPWSAQALGSLRLTFERRDITTARGERVAAKRYLHVAGFEISPSNAHHACEEWQGMVTLESEGTAEGRTQIMSRLGGNGPAQPGPWQVVRDKCMGGTVWLRLVPPPKQG